MTAMAGRSLAVLMVATFSLIGSFGTASAAAPPPPQTCSLPTSVTAAAIGGGAATVLWGPLGCSYYTVYAFSYSGSPQTLPVAYEGGVVLGGLTAGDAYTFTVIGYDAGSQQWTGWSGWSNWAVVTSGGMASLFDGSTLNGWSGNPAIWSVKNGAIDGTTSNGGQLIVSNGSYGTFRIIGSARMVQNLANHLGVCFWGSRSGFGYGGCIDFVPPSGSIWDYGGGGGVRTLPDFFKDRWNVFEILANLQTGVVRMAVNGTEFPVYTDTRLAQRKVGPIGLQIHAGASEVEYKDIYVDPAPTGTTLIT